MKEKNPLGLALLTRLLQFVKENEPAQTAERLYETFGGFSAVIDADAQTLMHAGELSEAAAVLMKLLPELVRRKRCQQFPMPRRISDEGLCPALQARYFGVMREILTVIAADANGRILDVLELEQGDDQSVGIRVSRVLKFAWDLRAAKLVLAHNHPDGFAVPSHHDIVVQHMMAQLARKADIELCRCIIVAEDGCVEVNV